MGVELKKLSPLGEIVEDTSPQLGGDLDLNGWGIIFPSVTILDALDEDDMISDSDTSLATQQSIKAYVDNATSLGLTAIVQDLTPQLGGNLDAQAFDITDVGMLGVGIAVPLHELTIYSTLTPAMHLIDSNTGLTATDGFVISLSSNRKAQLNNQENTNMDFFTNSMRRLTIASTGDVGIGTSIPNQKFTVQGAMSLAEQAAAGASAAAYGQLWVKDDSPNTLWFTDDAGNDIQLGITGIFNLVEDLTPTLGGNLDGGNFNISNVTDLIADGIVALGAAALIYPAADGNAGEFMMTDGVGNLSFAAVAAGTATSVSSKARKSTAGTIVKGTPVYLVSWNPSGYMQVEASDADDPTKMPAIGMTSIDTTNSATVDVFLEGTLTGVDTSAWSVGDELWVSIDPATTRGLVSTRPLGPTTDVQKVGIVMRSHASAGVVQIIGAGRTNDNPNIHKTDTFRLADVTDTTKLVNTDLSAITTAVTRTLTFPDTDIDLANVPTAAEKTVLGNTSGTNTGDQTLPVKASGAELDTATNDTKFATALAIEASKNVPSVVPGASGNLLESDGTDWQSVAPSGGSAPPHIPLAEANNGDEKSAAVNGAGDVFVLESTTASKMAPFNRRGSGMFMAITDFSTAASPTYIVGIGTQFVYRRGNTTASVINDDGTGDAALTFSGGTPSKIQTMGTDGTSIYIQDGVDKRATLIKRYTLSGTTLTFQDNRTLSSIPASGTVAVNSFAVNNGLIQVHWSVAGSGSSSEFRTYGESTGTQSEQLTLKNSIIYGQCIIGGKIYLYHGASTGTTFINDAIGLMLFDMT